MDIAHWPFSACRASVLLARGCARGVVALRYAWVVWASMCCSGGGVCVRIRGTWPRMGSPACPATRPAPAVSGQQPASAVPATQATSNPPRPAAAPLHNSSYPATASAQPNPTKPPRTPASNAPPPARPASRQTPPPACAASPVSYSCRISVRTGRPGIRVARWGSALPR
jgi:hypothetical protein